MSRCYQRERERDVDDTHAFVPPVFWVVVVMGGGDGWWRWGGGGGGTTIRVSSSEPKQPPPPRWIEGWLLGRVVTCLLRLPFW